MVKSKFEIIIWRILAFAIIFAQLFSYNIVFADEKGYDDMQIREEINSWLGNKNNNPIKYYTYEEGGMDKVMYALNMPEIPGNSKIQYDSSTQGYTYLIEKDGNVVGKVPIQVEVICMPVGTWPQGLNSDNYSQYVDGAGSTFLEKKDGSQLKLLDIDSNTLMKYAYVVRIDGGAAVVYDDYQNVEPKEQGKSLGEILEDAAAAALGFATSLVKNALTEIINRLLLGIGDGIQSLVNEVMGEEENLTVYKVIFNKIEKLDIDFWGIESASSNAKAGETGAETPEVEGGATPDDEGLIGESPRTVLKEIVAYWYNVLRGIGITIYLVMLLYIGVRILLASTTSAAQKYKEMLTAWGVGVVILILFPYVMKTVVIVNEAFVELLDSSAQTDFEDLEEKALADPEKAGSLYATVSDDPMVLVREQAEDDSNIALSIVYLIMLGQLIVLLGVYYKRVFMMAFLITIFPVVAVLYVWEKANKGAGRALTSWTKEYTVLVLTQTFHAMTYVVLVKGAYEAFLTSGNWFIFILSVVFLFEGEKIIRAIFGMKSSANTIGDLAAAGAAAWMTTKAVGSMFKSNKDKTSQDEGDEQDATNEVNDAKKATAVNNALSNRYNANQASAANAQNSSSSTGGTTPSSNVSPANNNTQQPNNQLDNLEVARALIRQQALQKRNKKKGKGLIEKGINVASRATGITLGLASGLASGSLKDGISNAVIANEFTGMAGRGIGGIVGYAKGLYSGQRMKMKIRSGAMDEELRKVGFDFGGSFDSDPALSSAKARIIREALASEVSGARSGGKVKGELKFVKAVEKGMKKENLH